MVLENGKITNLMQSKIRSIAGDASFRKFYRLTLNKSSKIIALAEKEKYKNLDPKLLPSTESLKDNQKRAMQAFHEKVAPLLVEGKDVLITAHGNTIRGMVKELDGISDEDISKFEIATGIPRVYEFDENLHILKVYNIES